MLPKQELVDEIRDELIASKLPEISTISVSKRTLLSLGLWYQSVSFISNLFNCMEYMCIRVCEYLIDGEGPRYHACGVYKTLVSQFILG